MSKDKLARSNHLAVKIAAGVTIAAIGGGVTYAEWIRRRKTVQMFDNAKEGDYQAQAKIFSESRLRKRQRQILAEVAISIYRTSVDFEDATTTQSLAEQLDISERRVQKALDLLGTAGQISSDNDQHVATDVLGWAVEAGGIPTLEQAEYDLIHETILGHKL